MTKRWWTIPALAGLCLTVAACGDETTDEAVVARVGEYTLTVDEAANLLVDAEELPNEVQVVEALAQLWVDYTLLADAVARDTTLAFLDLSPLVQQQLDQAMILQLRDSVMQVDTVVTDDELRALYETEAPGASYRARHILLQYPQGAAQSVRDSVRAQAEALRSRIVGGASFEALARQFSQDPGSAAQGGDLGFVQRGELVRPIDEAVSRLSPGEVGEVVESPFGYHVIRLEERRAAGFEEVRDQFRTRVQTRRYLTAESAFVAGVEERAEPELEEGALAVVRELAGAPGQRLSGRAARRPLMSYQGGAFTAGEFLTFVQGRPPQERTQIANATDEQLQNFLRGLVQRELLVAEARAAGLAPPRERVDSLTSQARERLRSLADQIGVLHIDRAPGEALQPAVSRAVRSAIGDILSGAANVVPLGQLTFQLRQNKTSAVYETGMGQAVLRVARMRAARSPAPADGTIPDSADGGAEGNGN